MDSLSQIVLGGAVAAAIAPAKHRRAALLAGAALGTLPDLDVLPVKLLLDDPIAQMTWHRGPSHSLLVLPWLAWMIWGLCKWRGGRVAEAPARWWWAILLALITHPLLDAFTVYGTQLLWPLATPPVMWSSVFIIDPLYTVWLLAACALAWWLREKRGAQRALLAGLLLSSAYLGWSLFAKQMIEQRAAAGLAAIGHAGAPRVSVPMPFNTLLWRVVAMTPEGYLEGEYSLLADRGAMQFRAYPSDVAALSEVQQLPAVARFGWFNHGFQRADEVEGQLILTDLRMGSEPHYFFRFVVARRDAAGHWAPVNTVQLPASRPSPDELLGVWQRIWQGAEPEA